MNMKIVTRALALVALANLADAQGVVNGQRSHLGSLSASGPYSAVDFTAAGSTAPVKTGTLAARPANCTQGDIYFATDVTAGQNLYFCTATGTPGTWTVQTGSGTAGTNPGSCSLASSLGFQLNGTDETALLNATLSAFYAAGGGCLAIDGGKTLRIDGQITIPNSGMPDCVSVPIRITGNAASAWGGLAGGRQGGGGSALDLRFNGTKLIALGIGGKLEIDHIRIIDGGADCGAYIKHTLTSVHIHDAAFVGKATPGAACNDAIVSGSTGPIGALSCTETDWAAGTAYIHHNTFYNMQRVWLGQTSANGNVIDSNNIFGGMSTGSKAAIDIQGYGTGINASRANMITKNLFEPWGHYYLCGINLHNAENTVITGNGFWDGDGGTSFLCGDSTATKNTVDKSNYVDVTGSKFTNSTWSENNYMPWRTVSFFFDGGGSPLSGTTTRCGLVPFGGVINRFSMAADQTGSATVTVKAVALGSFTGPASATDISNGWEVMTNAAKLQDTTLAGWTYAGGVTPLAPNTMLCLTLTNPSTITWLAGSVQVWEGR